MEEQEGIIERIKNAVGAVVALIICIIFSPFLIKKMNEEGERFKYTMEIEKLIKFDNITKEQRSILHWCLLEGMYYSLDPAIKPSELSEKRLEWRDTWRDIMQRNNLTIKSDYKLIYETFKRELSDKLGPLPTDEKKAMSELEPEEKAHDNSQQILGNFQQYPRSKDLG